MLNLKINKTDIPEYFDLDIVCDTGTTVTTVGYGLVHRNDAEDLLATLQDEIDKAFNRLSK